MYPNITSSSKAHQKEQGFESQLFYFYILSFILESFNLQKGTTRHLNNIAILMLGHLATKTHYLLLLFKTKLLLICFSVTHAHRYPLINHVKDQSTIALEKNIRKIRIKHQKGISLH